MEIVGPALLSSAQGDSHRTIATDLGLPADTVRGWIRKLTGQAELLRTAGTVASHMFNANLPDLLSTQVQSPRAEAISALGAAAAAARLMYPSPRHGSSSRPSPKDASDTVAQRLTPSRGPEPCPHPRDNLTTNDTATTSGPQTQCRFTVLGPHRTRRGHRHPTWRPTPSPRPHQ